MSTDREDWNQWDYLKAAHAAGWIDSGKTEPLRDTVQDAIRFLERASAWIPQGS